jgi:beta-ureidopropionase
VDDTGSGQAGERPGRVTVGSSGAAREAPSVRVAVIQTGPASDELSTNLAAARTAIRSLDPPPRAVLFPELFARPFWCVGLADPRYFEWAEDLDGPTLSALADEARALGAYLIAPFFERGRLEGEFYNSVAVLGPDGTLVEGRLPDGTRVATFRKHAISSYRWDGNVNDEKFYFRPGPGLPVFDTEIGPIGVLICYDRWYPEAWRVLALAGARIIFVPNASAGYVSETFVPLIRVSAAQNVVFAVASNKAGAEQVAGITTTYYGSSCICGPRGEVLAEVGDAPNAAIAADLDLSALGRARQRLWVYRDRRPELYGPIVEPRATG